MFAGDPAPFVMELPAYHWPTPSNILHSMWGVVLPSLRRQEQDILLATIICMVHAKLWLY